MSKVPFQTYSPQDISEILHERVGDVIQAAALKLCAKKVASTHGDARRAISICREAVNIAKRNLEASEDANVRDPEGGIPTCQPLVTLAHMAEALKNGRLSRFEDAIAALSVQAQMVLCVASALQGCRADEVMNERDVNGSSGCGKLTQGALHDKCAAVWGSLRTGAGLTHVEFSGTIDMLEMQGLMSVQKKRPIGGRSRQLTLLINWSDVEDALGDQPFFKAATSR